MTDPGVVRAQNEDAIAVDSDCGFAILADGMGGYSAGEVASRIAIDVGRALLERGFERDAGAAGNQQPTISVARRIVVGAIQKANTAIQEAAQAETQYHGMGTTLVIAAVHADELIVAHVGDSRGYRYREGMLKQITRDHSVLQEQIDAGLVDPALAKYSPVKNLVTRAVGVSGELNVEVHEHRLLPGDLYLFCSDGLTDMLSDDEIREILERDSATLEMACRSLIKKANDNGGFDNISVILAKAVSKGDDRAGLLQRIFHWAG